MGEVPVKEKRKELEDALDRLERCCPKNISDSIKQTLSSELRVALLNLDRARGREQRLREESDALLEGMNIIISSGSTKKAFNAILEVLKKLLSFDDAFVLREQGNGCLSSVASTSPLFENLIWQPGAMLRHVLAGNSTNVRDTSESADWQKLPPEILRNVSSALHTLFKTTTGRAMLVCTSGKNGFFNKSRIQLLERFSPLAGQALYNLEINDLLRDEINERKQAEKNLEAALTDLQNAKEELITANEALREAHDDLELRVEQRTSELRESNVLLQREIVERRRAEEEKEVLLREIHHRVKNNMQVISSLLNFQARYINDDQFVTVLNESQNRIKSMALIHEKLYQSGDLSNIDFNDYINSLAYDLFNFYSIDTGRIALKIDMDKITMEIDTAIPCGLLVNELLTNSLKHAFPDGRRGEIQIALRKEEVDTGANYDMTVSDNGIGIPEDFDITKTRSLGLHLVTTLTEHQLQGRLGVDRTKGTTFHIIFREIKHKKRI